MSPDDPSTRPESEPVLATLELPPSLGPHPSVEEVAVHLGLSLADIDAGFGIVPLDPERRLFAARLSRRPDRAAGSVTLHADPPIGPFGPSEGPG